MLARFLARPLTQQRVFVIRERASLPGADDAHNDQHLIICWILDPGFDTRIPDTKLDEVFKMKIRPALWLCLASLTLAVTSGMAQEVSISQKPKLKGFTIVRPARDANGNLRSPADASANSALAVQSPIYQATDFSFGPTSVGKTQYIDAFQRGNFSLQGTDYHTVLNPHVLPPVHLVFPANEALAIPSGLFGSCGPLGIVNIN